MGVAIAELMVPFMGAIQASVSVLLTIFFGVLCAQFNLLSGRSAKEVSSTCVRVFLPALLIYKVGSNLQQGTAVRYLPVLIWAVVYNVISMLLGVAATRILKLPSWVTPAIAFNNTTSLPLLLIQSLNATGILATILQDGDNAADAIDRAESYFLINSMVSNSLTFALGPRLLRPNDEDAPEHEDTEEDDAQDDQGDGEGSDMERGPDGVIDEDTSLLPQRLVRHTNRTGRRAYNKGQRRWENLSPWAQETLDVLYQFANAPIIGAIIGAIIGLTPPLHRLFFNDSTEGGYLNAWLTTAIKNVGDLFASLQIIVVGVKLSQSLRKMKRGEDSGEVSKTSFALVTLVRFFIWPLISIPLIWALASKTDLLADDPMLWFVLMLMPCGPPAMILVALTEVNGSPEMEKLAIAKFLTMSYAVTPLICFAVVGSLKASEAAISR
ncbi:auxin efflux carrier [Massariosphaeria phaeospora]|uniref:Auxin efflux carrier n=1 Tax=Massariosphaeria phaeospora TaxID=100035 RepID=A0A7C8I0Q6_9PLEO|nr:auxin efflux carrier [Massariosphaeria phaeospora]